MHLWWKNDVLNVMKGITQLEIEAVLETGSILYAKRFPHLPWIMNRLCQKQKGGKTITRQLQICWLYTYTYTLQISGRGFLSLS